MKKTTILFYFLFLTVTSVFAQSDIYTCIPSDGATSGNARAPHGRYRYERGIILIKPSEMVDADFVNGDVITSITFNYLLAQNIPTNATLILYLENTADLTNLKSTTWSTAGMTTVSNSTVTIPNTVGNVTFNFTGGSPFIYTGGGVYVAFDYQNATEPLPTTFVSVDCNSTGLVNGFLGGQSTTIIPTTLSASSFRPVILLEKNVLCARPRNIQENLALKTTTSITGSWTSTSATSIEYGPYGFTLGTGTQLMNITSPYTLTNLSPNTVYDVYFRNNCGTVITPINSAVTDRQSFHTVFLPSNPTYTTSFEQENFPFIGWTLLSGTPVPSNWRFGFFGPPSTTNTLTQDGSSSVFSLSGVTTTAANNWVISRGINLTAGNTATISFYARNYTALGSTGTSSYNVTVGTGQNVAAQTTTLGSVTNDATATWVLKTYTYTPTSNGVYYFGFQNVSAANAVGQQAIFIDNFSVSQTLSTDDFINSSLSVFPNPSRNLVTISNDMNAVIESFEMTDLNGRVVKSQIVNATQGQVSISDLSTGVYMMKIITNQGTATKKIIRE